MKRLKFFFVMLLSLVGMSAMAQDTSVLADGYYYMKSGIDGDDVWMTSLRNVVSLVPKARNFWSVWEVKCVDSKNSLYTFRNVGNSKVMTPATEPKAEELSTDEGYLYFDVAKTSYLVGDKSEGRIINMTLSKGNGSVYYVQPEGRKNRYYMSIDKSLDLTKDEGGNRLRSDHSLKSTDVNYASRQNWNFVPVTLDDVKKMYEDGVQSLNGYVGGLTTMEIPDVDLEELEPLKAIKALYENDSKDLPNSIDEIATKYQNFIQEVNKMRSKGAAAIFCQELVDGRPFWVETVGSRGGYGSRLVADDSNWGTSNAVNENTPAGTFYVERKDGVGRGNGKVIDPLTGNTTVYDQYYVMKNGRNEYLYTPETTTYSNPFQFGYSIVGKEWSEWIKEDRYQSNKPANYEVTKTNDKNKALQFTILPIIPGVYQISHIEPGWQGDPYLTFANANQLDSYRMAESYSYFKFKTYTAFDYTVSQAGNDVVGSYGNILHTKIEESGLNAYYIRGGKYAYNTDNTVKSMQQTPAGQMNDNDWGVDWDQKTGEMTVYFDQIPKVDNANVIQWMQGVILMSDKEDGKATVSAGKKEGQWYNGVIKQGSAQDIADNNMLHIAPNPILIDNTVWGSYYNYFVLAYKTDDKVVGYWHQQPVYGHGLGFYHVNRGSNIPTGKCYLSTTDIDNQLTKRYADTWNIRYLIPYPKETKASNSRAAAPAETEEDVVAGIRLVFRDCNGVFTGIEEAPIIDIEEDELEALTTLYSLDGKPVATPKSGEIYILNGKKVMF